MIGAREMVRDSISQCGICTAAGVPLAIEPLHPMYAADRACVNYDDTARAIYSTS